MRNTEDRGNYTRGDTARGAEWNPRTAFFDRSSKTASSPSRPCLRGSTLGIRVPSGLSYWSGALGRPVPPGRVDSGLLERRPHARVLKFGCARGRSGGVCVRSGRAPPRFPPSIQARGLGLVWCRHACGVGVAWGSTTCLYGLPGSAMSPISYS